MTGEEPTSSEAMPVNAARAKQLSDNLSSVISRINAIPVSHQSALRLVAVSKLKPANDILALFQSSHSQLHFGENYQQELQEKSKLLPKEIRWHFIGGLQTNKCKPLTENVPNLWCVESVDTSKKADQLEKGRATLCEKETQYAGTPLRVFVQVNTSGEREKSGCEPDETTQLCGHIRDKCPHLRLQGLMTIGAIARSKEAGEGKENEDFLSLRNVRKQVSEQLGLPQDELELSMGMSDDFESAIRCGSNEVRVGSTIFGERPQKQDARIQEVVSNGSS